MRAWRPERQLPVSSDEFYTSLTRLWRAWTGHNSRPTYPRSLALAVSGGADSMALAFLCRQMMSDRYFPNLTVKPFIIDHKARDKSTEEAHKVARWLEDLGLNPEILPLQWPTGVTPSQLTDFETRARRLRFQALGKACRQHNIPVLCLGHHQDDSVETALIRLSQGHRLMALRGVADVAHIPECQGIYGVAQSGNFFNPLGIWKSHEEPNRNAPDNALQNEDGTQPKNLSFRLWKDDLSLRVSDGGIYLLRPLTPFPKPRLLSTCSDNNVPFVTDRTNFDPTLTMRNTIRHLLATDSLPKALQAPSVLSLIETSKDATDSFTACINNFMESIKVVKLDLRSGTIVVQFPSPRQLHDSQKGQDDAATDALDRQIQAHAIRRIADVVSPGSENATHIGKFRNAPLVIFPKFKHKEDGDSVFPKHDTFTVGGVKLMPVKLNMKDDAPQHSLFSSNILRRSQRDILLDAFRNVPNLWQFSRCPFPDSLSKPITNFSLEIPDSSTTTATSWSDWQMWDSRFWIRVQAERVFKPYVRTKPRRTFPGTTIPLIIRPLETSDMKSIRDILLLYNHRMLALRDPRHAIRTNYDYSSQAPKTEIMTLKSFGLLLQRHLPGDMRFSIPVLAERGGKERILGFPTFGERMPISIVMGDENGPSFWNVTWEAMYKHVDPEIFKLGIWKTKVSKPVSEEEAGPGASLGEAAE
ncbi:tRNA(Ile)-lysidine synthetase [Polytolypa hystricis UAMH7299]|uniref:tRNA(Ile)-lysidine synthetase n=1 Tax=Polytolypa hystricis (strain UAMH7299) TaxID=1447883 RepID=A0A2B7Z2D0_POLH7|nr:tRNA(Ile)-lysidine synthetase [Polytolypa hystricis UAMH7299]